MKIVLPWPDRRLSPNARLHWKAKVGPKQATKIRTGWLVAGTPGYRQTKDALAGTTGPIPVQMRFYPPDARHRDDDNMIGSMKTARDAIAEALGVDDRRFRPHYFFEAPEKPGRVEVLIGDQVGDKEPFQPLAPNREGAEKKSAPNASWNSTSGADQNRIGAAK